MKIALKTLLVSMIALLPVLNCSAAVDTVVVNVEFVAPVTLATNTNLNFGKLDLNMAAAETVIVNTADTVTADAGANVIGGAPTSADLTVTATAAQTVVISVAQNTAGTYWAVSAFKCAYDGGAVTACNGAGYNVTSVASAVLKIGATLTGAGSAVAGVDNGSIDVTAVYQ